MTVPIDMPPRPSNRRRLSVRALMGLVGVLGLAMGLGQFWLANRDPDRAVIAQQLRVLADRKAPAMVRRAAVDAVADARGRQAGRAIRLLAAMRDDPDPSLRAGAARALGLASARALSASKGAATDVIRPAVAALLGALGDPDREVRAAAIWELAELIRLADQMKTRVVDPEEALPAVLGLVGADHPAIIGPGPDSWASASALHLAGRFLTTDPEVFSRCLALAAEAEDDRVRRGAILRLDLAGGGSGRLATLAVGGELRAFSDGDLAAFLVDRLRANPANDRPAILHVLQELALRVPFDAGQFAGIAEAADDPDPAVRWAVARILIGQPGSGRTALPGLLDGARRELDGMDEFPASWAVLAIGPRSAAAAEVRGRLVAALDDPGEDEGRRRAMGDLLLAHGNRVPGILGPELVALRRVAEAEAADDRLAPVACELILRLVPDSSEAVAVRSAMAEAIKMTEDCDRREELEAVARLDRDDPISADRLAPGPTGGEASPPRL